MSDTSSQLFAGAGVALLTLFDADGSLLIDETAGFAATLAEQGAAGILVAGTTGEFWTLTAEERHALTSAVRTAVPAAVPVLAGIGALTADSALRVAADVAATGADAALCFMPRGETPHAFYPKVKAAVGDLPLLAYHFPAAGYAPLGLEELADLPIDGIKDSSGEPGRLLDTAAVLPRNVYTGSALLAGLAAALQIAGAILAVANLEPGLASAAVHGDTSAQGVLARLHASIAGDVPPRALKRLAAERYGIPPHTRSPALKDALSQV